MNIRIIAIIAMFVTWQTVFSQGVFPSIEQHPVWKIQRSVEPGLPGPVYLMSYHMEKDTVINQKKYSLVLRNWGGLNGRVGFVRTDSKKVFFKKTSNGKEYLLYDFGLKLNERAYCPFEETDSAEYRVLQIDSVVINGNKRLRLKVTADGYYIEAPVTMFWIEGIGNLTNPFYHDVFEGGHFVDEVRCITVDAGQLYKNPRYEDCTTLLKKTDCIVRKGVVWTQMNIFKDKLGKDSVASYHIKFEGDTILNKLTYTKVLQSNDFSGKHWRLTGLIREADKRVYNRELGYAGYYDNLLYNFSVLTGNALQAIPYYYYVTMSKRNVDSVMVYGVKRLQIIENMGKGCLDTLIEKIGSLKGVMNRCNQGPDVQKVLLCVQDNGKTIYKDEAYPDCFYTHTISSVNQYVSLDDKIAVYPNPAKNALFIDNKGDNRILLNVRIMDVNGLTIYNKPVSEFHNTIDLSMVPSGLYFIRIINGQSIVNEKIIKQ